jgi:hypothetical protein
MRTGMKRHISVLIINKNRFRVLLATVAIACLIGTDLVSLQLSGSEVNKQRAAFSTTVFTKDGERLIFIYLIRHRFL